MIDLHTHTLFSDGELLPSELARRAEQIGVRALAFTDHVDYSNFRIVTTQIAQYCAGIEQSDITLIPGVEITHEPPRRIAGLIGECRELGSRLVVVHGETIVEPVAIGTNRAAIEGEADILAHPGLITDEDAKLAAEKGVALEISGRGGHSFTNGHVARQARKFGAPLVFNSDSHTPRDLMGKSMAESIAQGAGMTADEMENMFSFSQKLVERVQ
ncbi:Uncharacterized protein MJ1295 [hydrothermal vent metagenome]|uniref:Uncharacterized protein MJ1295 n=1 Tax=hydrothermal vent metagenome TaxID=652676 RepID=A0A3B1C5F4_9ZZZZ